MSVLTIRNGAFVPGLTQNILTTSVAQSSNVVGNTTSIVRISCQQDTYIELGSSPTASINSMIILSGSTEFLAVQPGTTIISVLKVGDPGIVSITQLTGY